MLNQRDLEKIIKHVTDNVSTFGGGRKIEGNPIAAALADQEPMFVAGVPVKKVVQLVISAWIELKEKRASF